MLHISADLGKVDPTDEMLGNPRDLIESYGELSTGLYGSITSNCTHIKELEATGKPIFFGILSNLICPIQTNNQGQVSISQWSQNT